MRFSKCDAALVGLLTESGYQETYYSTISSRPGTLFLVAAGMSSLALVMQFCLYSRIVKFERKHGPLTGRLQ